MCSARDSHEPRPMIVRTRKPRRAPKAEAQVAPPLSAAIVTASKPGPRGREPEAVEPEVEATVKAWFAKNIRPPAA